ncbi:VCBS repeat-containing protein, partial [candidate division WOR-3 bacterium]|nr:VCBS repeat-containing protein [candidate division WOR-3 bacterium]
MSQFKKSLLGKPVIPFLTFIAILGSNYAVASEPLFYTRSYYDARDGFSSSFCENKDSIPFAPAVNYEAGDHPESIFCADLDSDGDVDLAVANNFDSNISILKNNGDGTFADAINYAVGDEQPFSVFCADLDGDGDLDMAVPSYYLIAILKNNGDGTFDSPVYYGEGGNHFYSIFCADFDGDMDIDLAVTNSGSDNVSILKNNGDGTFESSVNYATEDSPTSVFCTDLDGDGDFDLATANGGSGNVSILTNNGDGTFDGAINYEAGSGSQSVFCTDLDGDGDFDLAVVNWTGNSVSILENLTQVPANMSPNSFSLISPVDSSSIYDVVTLNWETAYDPNLGDQISYDLYISTSIGFHPDSTIIDSNLILSQHTDTLDPGTYYWKVKAKDNWGAETWSTQTWSFGSYVGIDETESGLNKEFYLSQNYPNPFRDNTVITLECINRVDAAMTWSQHSINIYDLTGRLVHTFPLPSSLFSPLKIVWDGKDAKGNSVPSGIYFYELKTLIGINSCNRPSR